MSKLSLTKPTLILLYGFPGSGKTFFARQLCEDLQAAHVQGDRIRSELFEEPRYDRHENEIVSHLTEYMAEEFLNAGISVVYDVNAARIGQRTRMPAPGFEPPSAITIDDGLEAGSGAI